MSDGELGTSQRKAAEEEPTEKLRGKGTDEENAWLRAKDGHGPHQWKGREENPDRREIDSKLRMERNQKKNTTER